MAIIIPTLRNSFCQNGDSDPSVFALMIALSKLKVISMIIRISVVRTAPNPLPIATAASTARVAKIEKLKARSVDCFFEFLIATLRVYSTLYTGLV
jgi:hypothetical protein